MPDHAEGRAPWFNVSAGLIWKDGRLLIAKRGPGIHLEGLWEFPGGKQEEGEGLRECLRREIEEELGIVVKVEDPFMTVDHQYPGRGISLHVFNCAWLTGIPKPLESQEIRWVSPDELRGLPFPPPDMKVIEELIKITAVRLTLQ